MKVSYDYHENGYDVKGRKLPAVPVLWLELSLPSAKLRGPCIIDTGFDGAVYANEKLALLFEGVEPIGIDILYTVGEQEVECEVFKVEGYITSETGEPIVELGEVSVLIPTSPENLSYEVVVGRAILNTLKLKLNGKKVEVL